MLSRLLIKVWCYACWLGMINAAVNLSFPVDASTPQKASFSQVRFLNRSYGFL